MIFIDKQTSDIYELLFSSISESPIPNKYALGDITFQGDFDGEMKLEYIEENFYFLGFL